MSHAHTPGDLLACGSEAPSTARSTAHKPDMAVGEWEEDAA